MPKGITNTAQNLQVCTLPQMFLVWVVLCVFVASSTGLLPIFLLDLNMDQLELVENGENESESDQSESKLEKDKDNFIQSGSLRIAGLFTKLTDTNAGNLKWENRFQDIYTPPPERF